MSSPPAVIVRKGGALSALAYGFFGLLVTTVACAAGLGVYGMWIAQNKFDRLLSTSAGLLANLPDWQAALPPALADGLRDRRAPEYRRQLDVTVRLVPRSRGPRAVVAVSNQGPETVSLLALRVVVLDQDGVPAQERICYAATPVALDDGWRGPLLPGAARELALPLGTPGGAGTVRHEIVELRLWQAVPPPGADQPG